MRRNHFYYNGEGFLLGVSRLVLCAWESRIWCCFACVSFWSCNISGAALPESHFEFQHLNTFPCCSAQTSSFFPGNTFPCWLPCLNFWLFPAVCPVLCCAVLWCAGEKLTMFPRLPRPRKIFFPISPPNRARGSFCEEKYFLKNILSPSHVKGFLLRVNFWGISATIYYNG